MLSNGNISEVTEVQSIWGTMGKMYRDEESEKWSFSSAELKKTKSKMAGNSVLLVHDCFPQVRHSKLTQFTYCK